MERVWSSWRISAIQYPYPFLAAVITVTALVAANPDEGIRLANITVPITVALLVALVSWSVGAFVVRDRERQGAIALVVSLPLLTSGYLFGWIRANATSGVLSDSAEIGFTLALIVGGAWLIRRLPPPPPTVSQFLNTLTLVLLAFTVPAVVRLVGATDADPPESVIRHVDPAAPRPDIYFFVLDAYTGNESLREIYGFDNTPMMDSLRLRGFRFPNRPRSNYTKTFLSVGTIMNRRYADDLVESAAPGYRDRRPAYRALEFNQTAIDLKHLGYEFVYVGSSFPPMADNRLSDTRSSTGISREFEAVWSHMTIIVPVLRAHCRLTSCPLRGRPFAAENAADTERQLDVLRASFSRASPKFVYAHLLLPHGPLRFGPACEHNAPIWTTKFDGIADTTTNRLFIDQVKCTNRKLLELVDSIREESGDSSVILLQADHGYARFPAGIPSEFESAAADQIRERFDVFAAYAGPGSLADSLAAYRTPVNLFRTLFRLLWDADEPPLADRHYWSGTSQPMLLTEVAVD